MAKVIALSRIKRGIPFQFLKLPSFYHRSFNIFFVKKDIATIAENISHTWKRKERSLIYLTNRIDSFE